MNSIKIMFLIAAIAVVGCGGMTTGNLDGVSETQSAVCSPPSAITGTAYMTSDVWSDTVASMSCPNCGSCDICAALCTWSADRVQLSVQGTGP